jgi:hypothetical protein
MLIIGVDYHPSFQQIAFVDQETGECGERRLNHGDGEAEKVEVWIEEIVCGETGLLEGSDHSWRNLRIVR